MANLTNEVWTALPTQDYEYRETVDEPFAGGSTRVGESDVGFKGKYLMTKKQASNNMPSQSFKRKTATITIKVVQLDFKVAVVRLTKTLGIVEAAAATIDHFSLANLNTIDPGGFLSCGSHRK